ncbi:MAG: type I-E CRISPR-associated endonuclease Cas1e [Candidatus Helarchaeota archaeon]
MKDLRELPKFRDGLSYLYVEHCKIVQDKQAIAIFDKEGKTPIPCASLAILMIGPGVSITSEAIKNLSKTGCLVTWCGEEGVRFYAHGMGKTRSANKLLLQSYLAAHDDLRLKVVKNMYAIRFHEPIKEELSLQQLRGLEGSHMRKIYAHYSKITGVEWKGRHYNRGNWSQADPINRAISAANACLYGICHAAIIAAGYAAGLGFLHVGKQLSFVYDIADFYKADITIPCAFYVVKAGTQKIESRIRHTLREEFKSQSLLKRIIPDIEKALTVTDQHGKTIGPANIADFEGSFAIDKSVPGFLWDPKVGTVAGGRNYYDDDED